MTERPLPIRPPDPAVAPQPAPVHNPRTMSYKTGKIERFETDRGEFGFKKNGGGRD